MAFDLADIRKARERISPYTRRTPFLPFENLSKKTGKTIWMKCESLQRTGSFKIRGAANCILENMAAAKKSGVIAASAGNHAQGVAAMSSLLGIKATIVMPQTTPAIKVQNTSAWGAKIELSGESYNDSYVRAQELARSDGLVFVHPYNDPLIMAGQGTVALEMLEEKDFAGVEAVVISVGGGGLISGCATVLRQLAPRVKIYGVSAQNAPAFYKSFQSGQVTEQPVSHTIAEGVATKKTEPEMLALLKKNLDDFFSIGEDSIANAISTVAEHAKLIVEGAGALPIAAILNGLIPEKNVAVVLSGGNIDIPALSNALQRGLVEQDRLVRLLIWVPDRPGGLNSVTEILAQRRANILEVVHQRMTLHAPFGDTEIEIDMETRGKEHTDEILAALAKSGVRVQRLA
ncbi:MAG: threonine ammonia-lyase [Deltaproteobacteria bacterium]|nr:threonine ammonia-lyase [Deltaproteobacteria bacterium]MBI3295393.1 threonine ammonia-lyase [Deltaproteobacteria bacterium]